MLNLNFNLVLFCKESSNKIYCILFTKKKFQLWFSVGLPSDTHQPLNMSKFTKVQNGSRGRWKFAQ